MIHGKSNRWEIFGGVKLVKLCVIWLITSSENLSLSIQSFKHWQIGEGLEFNYQLINWFLVFSVPARIHHISSGGHLQVKKGGSVRIECSASGNPRFNSISRSINSILIISIFSSPNVTWTRKNNILPNGEVNWPKNDDRFY